MTSSIFWYDYETTGINPRADRPIQVAGIRTDEALNEVAPPLNIYCRLSDDILPHPQACLVTGITPSTLQTRGLDEAEFIQRVHAELALPGTCGAGYNTLRFDDEVTRYSLYRNFYDPYAREWQGGNSRWDLIDLVRTAYALRPDGIEWPQEQGRVTLKLERLTQANGIDHGQAHDALSDVRATIGLARLLRERQPRLYDYLYQLRSKHRVLDQISLLKPVLHISGRFSADRHYLAPVLPLAWHPRNKNALIVCDLQADPTPLLQLSAEAIRKRLYTRRNELAEGELPIPLKLVHINKCPVLAPLSVLRPEDYQRLQLDWEVCKQHAALLASTQGEWQTKLAEIYLDEGFAESGDPEQQLYQGFIGNRDRQVCEQVRQAEPHELAGLGQAFSDQRLPELLWRYRARYFAQTLTAPEQQAWQDFCRLRLTDAEAGAPNTLLQFQQALQQALSVATDQQRELLTQWQHYAQNLADKYALS